MPRANVLESATLRDACLGMNVEELKALARLIGKDLPNRKNELVERLCVVLQDAGQVRQLYAGLDALNQAAIQEAVHGDGQHHAERFQAKYGQGPDFGKSGRYREAPPTRLRLFFPRHDCMPNDLREMLRSFVPEPRPLQAVSHNELPARVQRPHYEMGSYWTPDPGEVELRVRLTAQLALQNIKAMLRLVAAGRVKVSETTRRPGQNTIQTIADILAQGDFYAAGDRSKWKYDPAADVAIQGFAWPLILQAAGLAQLAGTRLQLLPVGRKAISQPACEVVRLAWDRWLKSTHFDEFNRVDIIKGQRVKGRGSLTAVVPRRLAVVGVLKECPVGQWLTIEELFRLAKAGGLHFQVDQDLWALHVCNLQYGSFGYDARYAWEALQGRYILAFLFEYAATLGLIDVAYIPPEGSRNDFHDRWGTDDFSCLSRYDGLMYIRINALGAYCLGIATSYTPQALEGRRVLKVLPNLDVVISTPPIDPADALILERFAEKQSELVWRLTRPKVLAAVEKGLTVAEVRDFLASRSQEPLPQIAAIFLADLEKQAGLLEDQGPARLVACADPAVAQLIASDRQLRGQCLLAGEGYLVIRAGSEVVVRRRLRELGYVLPVER